MPDLPIPRETLVQRFAGGRKVLALALMGSYARGQAGPYSDIDVVRFIADSAPDMPDDGSHVVQGHLVVASSVREHQVLRWFERPEEAVDHLMGLRHAQVMLDNEGFLELLQDKAHRFEWDSAMQDRADQWASRQLVGWSEEVHKGLEGLRRVDVGRLLNARHGCSFGLSRVVQVHRGILAAGDNDFYAAVETELGPDSDWVRLRRAAFGIENEAGRGPTLREQVMAGLQLYVATAALVGSAIQSEDRRVIEHTLQQIRSELVRHARPGDAPAG